MAKKIRFPLQMNGTDVRTIEELRDNFDLESVLGYFANGKLVTWLKDRYYDNEAMAISGLSDTDTDLNQKLMSILGITADTENKEIDMEAIQRRNEKLVLLRQITDDKEVINNVDCVAFNQDDLLDILDEGVKKIYLCQGNFEIPLSVKDITYYGVDNPSVSLRELKNENTFSANIKFVGITIPGEFDNNDDINNVSCAKDVECYKKRANEGDATAQYQLGCLYENGLGVELSYHEAFKWYTKAAEQGYADAQFSLGSCYASGKGVNKSLNRALEWYQKAAKQGHAESQFNVGKFFYYGVAYTVGKNCEKAVEWYRKAAEQGHDEAQYNLGWCYENGKGVEKNYEKAVEWYRKAAEQGHIHSQYDLGSCYEHGKGVSRNRQEAVKWYQKAAEQGYEYAQKSLKKLGVTW